MRFLLLALPLAAGSLAAQTSAPLARATASITAADVANRIRIIADDSMMGRDTPSPGLEVTARYVADQFQKFGLRPGGKDGSWFQRYPITRRQLDLAGSRVVFQAGAVTGVARLDRSARHTTGDVPEQPVSGPAIVVGGPLTVEDVGRMALKDKVVLHVVDVRRPAPENSSQLARAFRLAGPRAVVQLVNVDSTTFAARVPRRAAPRTAIGETGQRPPVLEVTDAVLRPVLRSADLDLNAVRAATAPVARDVPALSVRLEMKDSVLASNSAPNTIGILEGSDPRLKEEYVVFSAHMDHIGITPGQPDSINNGADDDASG
ncbi:MAG: M28 family peptidase, partial [Gemmatimonadales bacterium]